MWVVRYLLRIDIIAGSLRQAFTAIGGAAVVAAIFFAYVAASQSKEIAERDLAIGLLVDTVNEQKTVWQVRDLYKSPSANREKIDSLRRVARRKRTVWPLP